MKYIPKIIVYSSPDSFDEEVSILIQLFETGLKYFHIRKPSMDKVDLEAYISKIPKIHHRKIVLHQHHELTKEYALKGVHYPEQYRQQLGQVAFKSEAARYRKSGLIVSTSVHHLTDIKPLDKICDYITVSPIFDSISKEDYKANPDLDISPFVRNLETKLIALGGITAANMDNALEKGFHGIGVLGYIWKDKKKAVNCFCKLYF